MKNSLNKKFILYKATSPSGKIYIGITCGNLEDRKSKHKYTSNRMNKSHKFSNAIRKYGINGFKWEIIFDNLCKTEAIRLEIEYIKNYNTYKNGYNSTRGGEGAWGYKWKKEDIKKHIDYKKRVYYNNPEWKKRKSKITKDWFKNNPIKAQKHKEKLIKRLNKDRHKWEQKRIEQIKKPESIAKMVRSRGCEEFNVYCIKTRKYIGTWLHKTVCAKELNIISSKIGSCLNGNRNQTGGYIFRLISDPEVKGKEIQDHWFDDLKRSMNGVRKNT